MVGPGPARAQVSTPFRWDELESIAPDELTIATVPARISQLGDPWAAMADEPQSLVPVLALHERDRAAGLADAPWPPVYPKMPGEPPRVAPSRAKKLSHDASGAHLRCQACGAGYALDEGAWRCRCGGLFDLESPLPDNAFAGLEAQPWSLWRYRRALPFSASATGWQLTMGEGPRRSWPWTWACG